MKKILIAVDSTNNSRTILSVFNNLVRPPEKIILLHVEQLEGNSMMTSMLGDAEMSTLKDMLKETEHKGRLDARAEKILGFYKKELGNGGLLNIQTVIREGNPSEEILKVAEEEAADMIIVGCSGKSKLHKLITGCASREIEKSSKVPVLVAKDDGCGRHDHVWGEAYALK